MIAVWTSEETGVSAPQPRYRVDPAGWRARPDVHPNRDREARVQCIGRGRHFGLRRFASSEPRGCRIRPRRTSPRHSAADGGDFTTHRRSTSSCVDWASRGGQVLDRPDGHRRTTDPLVPDLADSMVSRPSRERLRVDAEEPCCLGGGHGRLHGPTMTDHRVASLEPPGVQWLLSEVGSYRFGQPSVRHRGVPGMVVPAMFSMESVCTSGTCIGLSQSGHFGPVLVVMAESL